jgi:hypothetical protein
VLHEPIVFGGLVVQSALLQQLVAVLRMHAAPHMVALGEHG